MRDDCSAASLNLEIVDHHHALWPEVTQQITRRYQQAFDARLCSFMPAFMALMMDNEIKSLCGFRMAHNEPLFLEQYLDEQADVLLSHTFNTHIQRTQLIEFGQLASFTNGISPLHFLLMTETLVELGFEWCIFTATDPLHALMRRLGLRPLVIAEADPSRIPQAGTIWGTYYQHQPRILAGNLQQGLTLLRAQRQGLTNKVIGG